MLNELRNLKPAIRLALLEGRQQYRDQEAPIEFEDDTAKKLQQSGQLKAMGGQSAAAVDPQLLMRDKLIRTPHVSSEQ